MLACYKTAKDESSGKVSATEPIECSTIVQGDETGLRFCHALPFGFSFNGIDPETHQENWWPDQSYGSQSYFTSPIAPNSFFWGWDWFFELTDQMLTQAKLRGLAVKALDYFQETNMIDFPIEARMIHDANPDNEVDVLGRLQDIMEHGLHVDPQHPETDHEFGRGQVGLSTAATWGPDIAAYTPSCPSPGSQDCCNRTWYSDSPLAINASAVMAAMTGAQRIGSVPKHGYNGLLYCYDPSADLDPEANSQVFVPGTRDVPTSIDVHSQREYPLAADNARWAKSFYNGIFGFLANASWALAPTTIAIFGETNPVSNPGCPDAWTFDQARNMLLGTPGSNNGYRHSDLFTNAASRVVMRPWHTSDDPCTPSPNVINPPFDASRP